MNLLKKLIIYLYKKLGCEYCDTPVSIPDVPVVECVISTPQFKSYGGHYMFEQSGSFHKDTLKFFPFKSKNGRHEVQFHTYADFCKSVVKVL